MPVQYHPPSREALAEARAIVANPETSAHLSDVDRALRFARCWGILTAARRDEAQTLHLTPAPNPGDAA